MTTRVGARRSCRMAVPRSPALQSATRYARPASAHDLRARFARRSGPFADADGAASEPGPDLPRRVRPTRSAGRGLPGTAGQRALHCMRAPANPRRGASPTQRNFRATSSTGPQRDRATAAPDRRCGRPTGGTARGRCGGPLEAGNGIRPARWRADSSPQRSASTASAASAIQAADRTPDPYSIRSTRPGRSDALQCLTLNWRRHREAREVIGSPRITRDRCRRVSWLRTPGDAAPRRPAEPSRPSTGPHPSAREPVPVQHHPGAARWPPYPGPRTTCSRRSNSPPP